MTMDSSCSDGGLLRQVSPFRNLRIVVYLPLPAAYRSLSRLSSALSAKASTLRSFLLDLNLISIALEMIGFATNFSLFYKLLFDIFGLLFLGCLD